MQSNEALLRQPTVLLWLSYAWLAEGALFVRYFQAFFGRFGSTGGTGTGGILLLIPVALGALVLAPICFALAYGLHQGQGIGAIKVFSGLGLTLAVLGGLPLLLIIFIAVALMYTEGMKLEAVPLVALPILFIMTLIIVHFGETKVYLDALAGGQALRPPRDAFLKAGGIALILFFAVPFLIDVGKKKRAEAERLAHPPISYEEQQILTQRYEAAVRADDPGPLASVDIFKSEVVLPGPGYMGDLLELAIVLRKPAATKVLAQQNKLLWRYTGTALQYGDAATWKILADLKAPFDSQDAQTGAFQRNDVLGIEFLVAHGVAPGALLEQASKFNYLPQTKAKVDWLLAHGARSPGAAGGE
jgi:hypothetical protein